jgi:hypothetical protein
VLQFIRMNHHQECLDLLRSGAVHDVDEDNPILLACQRGWSDVVLELVNRGADLNVASEMGETPLMRAIKAGDKIEAAVVSKMLAHGATQTINSRTTTKHFFPEWSALHFACDSSLNRDSHIIALLIRGGADPKVKNSDGLTPMDLAKSFPRHAEAIKNPAEHLKSIKRSVSTPDMSPASSARRLALETSMPPELDIAGATTVAESAERKTSMISFAGSLLGTNRHSKKPPASHGKGHE